MTPRTHDPARTAVRCPTCQVTIAYVSTAAVKRAAGMAGFGLFTADHALRSVANAGALRCVDCEGKAVTADAIAHAKLQGEL